MNQRPKITPILPTVYGESLSYLELLGKVVEAINGYNEAFDNGLTDEITAWIQANYNELFFNATYDAARDTLVMSLAESLAAKAGNEPVSYFELAGQVLEIVDKVAREQMETLQTDYAAFKESVNDELSEISGTVSNLIVNVTSLGVDNTGAKDAAGVVQSLINSGNYAHTTLFFPAGVYTFNSAVRTPAANDKKIAFLFDKSAVVRAGTTLTGFFFEFDAIERTGYDYYEPYNMTRVSGGYFDCQGRSNGLWLTGYPVNLSNTIITNTKDIGIQMGSSDFEGFNSTSSDCQLNNLTLCGNDVKDSKGLLVYGSDNGFTDIRISGFRKGMVIYGGSQIVRNIHTLHHGVFNGDYPTDSIGFQIKSSGNVFTACYADAHAIGYQVELAKSNFFTDCTAYWWNDPAYKTVAFKSAGGKPDNNLNSFIIGFKVRFAGGSGERLIYEGTTDNRLDVDDRSNYGYFMSPVLDGTVYVSQDNLRRFKMHCVGLNGGNGFYTGSAKPDDPLRLDYMTKGMIIAFTNSGSSLKLFNYNNLRTLATEGAAPEYTIKVSIGGGITITPTSGGVYFTVVGGTY